jgi:hypothetical protein
VFDQKISGVSYINRSCCNFFFDVKEVYVSVLCSIEKITGSIILVHSEFVHICFDVVDKHDVTLNTQKATTDIVFVDDNKR